MMIDTTDRERENLWSITALNLGEYLRRAGWNYVGKRGRYADIFKMELDDQRRKTVTVPVFESLDDHADRIGDAVHALAEIEGRSESAVLLDLAKVDNDTVQISSTNGRARRNLTVSQSADLLRNVNDLMTNAARAAEAAETNTCKAAYRGSISHRVASFMDSLTYVQGPTLGYQVTLHSPVAVEVGQTADFGDDEYGSPFSRATTAMLARTLTSTKEALANSLTSRSTDPFREAVPSGVSANFCDALSRLAKEGRGISVDLKWSMLRRPSLSYDTVFVTYQHADVLQSAADLLRRAEPSREEQIHCYVTKLEREPDEFDGKATLLAFRDGRYVRMDAEFEENEYTLVIDAFTTQHELSLVGDIHPRGTRLELRSPRSLRLLPT